jgi:hypothetical protein
MYDTYHAVHPHVLLDVVLPESAEWACDASKVSATAVESGRLATPVRLVMPNHIVSYNRLEGCYHFQGLGVFSRDGIHRTRRDRRLNLGYSVGHQ